MCYEKIAVVRPSHLEGVDVFDDKPEKVGWLVPWINHCPNVAPKEVLGPVEEHARWLDRNRRHGVFRSKVRNNVGQSAAKRKGKSALKIVMSNCLCYWIVVNKEFERQFWLDIINTHPLKAHCPWNGHFSCRNSQSLSCSAFLDRGNASLHPMGLYLKGNQSNSVMSGWQ